MLRFRPLSADQIGMIRRASPVMSAAALAERIAAGEVRQAGVNLTTATDDDTIELRGTVTVDNRYQEGSLLLDANGAGANILIVGRGANGLPHTIEFVDPNTGDRPIGQEVTQDDTGLATVKIKLATPPPRVDVVPAVGAVLRLTGKPGGGGKLHTFELVVAGSTTSLSVDVAVDANGVAAVTLHSATDGLSAPITTVAEAIAALSTGLASVFLTATQQMGTGTETVGALGSTALVALAPTSTLDEVVAELDKLPAAAFIEGRVMAPATGSEVAVSLGPTPLDALVPSSSKDTTVHLGGSAAASTLVDAYAVVDSVDGQGDAKLQAGVTDLTAAATLTALGVGVMTDLPIVEGEETLDAGAVVSANLSCPAGSVLQASIAARLAVSAAPAAQRALLLSLHGPADVTGAAVSVRRYTGTEDAAVRILTDEGGEVIDELVVTSADDGNTLDAVLGAAAAIAAAGGRVWVEVDPPADGEIDVAVVVDYVLTGLPGFVPFLP